MNIILDELREALEKAKLTNRLNPPASPEAIADWERTHGAVIPDEIKEFLQFSDGFEYGWGSIRIYPLKKIGFVRGWDNVPDGWLDLGSIIGDGAYLVGRPDGTLFLADHESRPPLMEYSLKEWLDDSIIPSIEEDIEE